MHDLGQRFAAGAGALAAGVGILGLGQHQLPFQFDQLLVFGIEPFVGAENAVQLLVIRELLLGFIQARAQLAGAAFEPVRVLPGRFHFQFDVGIDIGLGEGVGDSGGKARVGGLEADGDDVGFTRGFDVEFLLQQFGQPGLDGALAFGIVLPVFDHLGVLVQA